MPEFQNLRGFRDILPGEMAARRKVFDRIAAAVQSFGFREIDLPALEPLDLFLVKSGEELVEQTYSFTDKGDRDVTLVPEQTPSRARIVADDKSLSRPVKWYSTSKRWRYEAPQKGRLREFYQTDIDIFGVDSVQADVEILAVAADIMERLEVLDAVDILVNDRRLLKDILREWGLGAEEDRERVLRLIDDKEKMSEEEFKEELEDVLSSAELSGDHSKERRIDAIYDITEQQGDIPEIIETVRNDILPVTPDKSAEAIERLEKLQQTLEAHGLQDQITMDLSIVRGLAYYTGLVFEIFDTEGDLRAVCGGGRYDELVDLFGGQTVPAVGFAIGDAVIEELMKREGVWPAEEIATDYYVLPVSDGVRDTALEIATALRKEGKVVEVDVKGRGVGDQFDYADTINAEQVVVVGERDLEQGKVTVKDMDSGEEEQVPLDEFLG